MDLLGMTIEYRGVIRYNRLNQLEAKRLLKARKSQELRALVLRQQA
jgi:hypothetical protein